MTTLTKVKLAKFTKAGHKIHTCTYLSAKDKHCGNRYIQTMKEQDIIKICMRCLYNK